VRVRSPLTAAALTLLSLCLLGSPRAIAAEEPAPERTHRPPLRVSTLSNGLRLLCRTNDSSEIVSIVCLVRAGLPDESEAQAGLAALTAEALLHGSSRHSPAAFGEMVNRAGGNLQATPGFDFTEITIVTGRDQFENALKLIDSVLAHPRFSPEGVEQARANVRRRLAAIDADFTGASYQALVSGLYTSSPYGRPVHGFGATLDRLTADDVRRFWKQNYVQNRMVIAIVGDVDSYRAMSVAQKAFSEIPFDAAQAQPAAGANRLSRPVVEIIRREGPAAQLMAGFLVPGATRESYPVYAVLDAIIGGGKRGRLFRNIRERHSLGYELGSFYQPLRFQSHLVGYVVTPQRRRNPHTREIEPVMDLVKTHLLDQFREIAAAGPTEDELERAKAFVIGRYLLRQERTRDQAKWLAWNVAMGLRHDFDEYFVQAVKSLSMEQVRRAAESTTGGYALVVTIPESPGGIAPVER
jgi:zinc protease